MASDILCTAYPPRLKGLSRVSWWCIQDVPMSPPLYILRVRTFLGYILRAANPPAWREHSEWSFKPDLPEAGRPQGAVVSRCLVYAPPVLHGPEVTGVL